MSAPNDDLAAIIERKAQELGIDSALASQLASNVGDELGPIEHAWHFTTNPDLGDSQKDRYVQMDEELVDHALRIQEGNFRIAANEHVTRRAAGPWVVQS